MDVPFPLSTGKTCGHPSYPVNCTSENELHLVGLSGSYRIQSIDAIQSTMVIETGAFVGSSCITQDSAGHRTFSLHPLSPFFITQRNTVMLFNCTQTLLYSPLHCDASSPCWKVMETKAQNCRHTPLCCSFTTLPFFNKSFPISGQETAYVGVVDLNVTEQADKWSYGLQIGWTHAREPPCKAQVDCAPNSSCLRSGNTSACLCNEGYKWNSFSGTCLKVPLCAAGNSSSMRCHKKAYISGIICGILAVILLLSMLWMAYTRVQAQRQARVKLIRERSLILATNSGGKSARLFSSREMNKATKGFSKDRILGSGGFGEVYKGILQDGTVVAIKTAKMGNIKGTEQVLNEVRVLSLVNHKSLVRLLGCCVDHEQPLMVYEYVPNGNLYEHLSGTDGHFLDWKTRLNIAFQSAEALAYLHSAAYPPIYHRDVKSCNILLDKDMNAKVADFGLSRLAEPDMTHISTCAQGTLGYLDPEYYRSYQLTDKSDVYSFGVVLLELLTSQKAIDLGRGQDEVNLAVLVEMKVEMGKIHEVWDPKLVEGASKSTLECMKAFTFLALSCLQESRSERPTMKEVAEQLSYMLTTVAKD